MTTTNNAFAPPEHDERLRKRPRGPSVRGLVFADPRGRAKVAIIIMGFVAGCLVVNVVAMLMQIELLGGEFTEMEAEANDRIVQAIAAVYLVAFVLSVIFFSRWLLMSNRNCRVLARRQETGRRRRRERLNIVGGWVVGWYFIPIANLWKPYQSMSEMFRVCGLSVGVVTAWWTLWIISNFIGNISMRVYGAADTVDALRVASYLDITDSVFTMLAAIAVITVIRRLSAAQVAAMTDDEER